MLINKGFPSVVRFRMLLESLFVLVEDRTNKRCGVDRNVEWG